MYIIVKTKEARKLQIKKISFRRDPKIKSSDQDGTDSVCLWPDIYISPKLLLLNLRIYCNLHYLFNGINLILDIVM